RAVGDEVDAALERGDENLAALEGQGRDGLLETLVQDLEDVARLGEGGGPQGRGEQEAAEAEVTAQHGAGQHSPGRPPGPAPPRAAGPGAEGVRGIGPLPRARCRGPRATGSPQGGAPGRWPPRRRA